MNFNLYNLLNNINNRNYCNNQKIKENSSDNH